MVQLDFIIELSATNARTEPAELVPAKNLINNLASVKCINFG